MYTFKVMLEGYEGDIKYVMVHADDPFEAMAIAGNGNWQPVKAMLVK